MEIRRFGAVWLGLAVLGGALLAGCTAHALRVDCDGTLTPINAPVPVTSDASPAPSGERP